MSRGFFSLSLFARTQGFHCFEKFIRRINIKSRSFFLARKFFRSRLFAILSEQFLGASHFEFTAHEVSVDNSLAEVNAENQDLIHLLECKIFDLINPMGMFGLDPLINLKSKASKKQIQIVNK